MGKHSDPNRKDTNPFGQIFRKFEPAHTGFEPDTDSPPEHTVPPIARTDGDGFPAITSTEPDDGTGGTMPPFLPPADEATEYIRFGAPPVRPFEPDDTPLPESYLADYELSEGEREIVRNRAPARWPIALGLSVALCAALAAGAVGRATAPGTPVSDQHSPRETVTVTTTPSPKATAGPKRSGAQPRPTVTAWRTRTPKPEVRVSTVPGPVIRTTQFITPEPVVSVRISKVPVPGPTKTVECVITITVNRSGVELDRETSGVC